MAIVTQTLDAIQPSVLYAQLISAVYTLTNRPDLVAETQLALRKATVKAHGADFWKADIAVVPKYTLPIPVVDVTQPSSRFVINLVDATNFPNLRKVAYIKEYINPAGQVSSSISGWDTLIANYGTSPRQRNYDECSPESVIDDYGTERTNYWYQAGKQVSLRTYTPILYATLGYWAYPNATPAGYNSWIANDFPDLVVEEAASIVFRTIGKAEESAAYAGNWGTNLHQLSMSQITVSTSL
jgi:hypothetical protein